MKKQMKTILCFIILTSTLYLSAATNYVSKTGANVPPYDSWANAATNIQTAVTASGANNIILVGDGTYYPTNQIELRDNRIVISANGVNKTVVDGSATNKSFRLYDNSTISGLTISNCYQAHSGGAISFDSGNETVTNCVFTHNSAGGWGGAIYLNHGGTIVNCTFTHNSISGDKGGALLLSGGGIVRDCVFTYNSATNYGGAVCCYGSGSLENCLFERNSANNVKGGAVYCYKGGSFSNCNFNLNHATSYGGAVYCYQGGFFIDCNFTTNYSLGNGGAVYLKSGGILTNCIIKNCSAISYGGAVYCDGDGILQNCDIINNYSDELAGGIWTYDGTVDNCNIISNNSAGHAAGINCKNNCIVQDCLIAENWAVESSGGVYFESSGTYGILRRCIISNNFADSIGGIRVNKDTVVENCLINANRADRTAGGAYVNGGTLQNCTVVDNFAGNNGGGVYCYTGTVVNCILWNNNDGDYFEPGNENIYNCIDGWTNIVDNIISNDPTFYSDTDFRLLDGSTCLNSGTNLPGLSSQKDLNGNPRVVDGKVDIGCYQGAVPEPFLFINFYLLFIIYYRKK